MNNHSPEALNTPDQEPKLEYTKPLVSENVPESAVYKVVDEATSQQELDRLQEGLKDPTRATNIIRQSALNSNEKRTASEDYVPQDEFAATLETKIAEKRDAITSKQNKTARRQAKKFQDQVVANNNFEDPEHIPEEILDDVTSGEILNELHLQETGPQASLKERIVGANTSTELVAALYDAQENLISNSPSLSPLDSIYTPEELSHVVAKVFSGDALIEEVPSEHGLRQKVYDIYLNENGQNKPKTDESTGRYEDDQPAAEPKKSRPKPALPKADIYAKAKRTPLPIQLPKSLQKPPQSAWSRLKQSTRNFGSWFKRKIRWNDEE